MINSQQLTRVKASDRSQVIYAYEGNRVSRTDELSSAGWWIAKCEYQYFPSIHWLLHRAMVLVAEPLFNRIADRAVFFYYPSLGLVLVGL